MTVVYKVQFCRRSPVRSPAQNLHGKKRGGEYLINLVFSFYWIRFWTFEVLSFGIKWKSKPLVIVSFIIQWIVKYKAI